MTGTPPPLTTSYEQILRAMLAEPWTGFSRDDVAALLGEIGRLRIAAQAAATLLRSTADKTTTGRPLDLDTLRHAATALDDITTN
ncbi:hypothetical protein [Kitasatospora sp. NPDC001683]